MFYTNYSTARLEIIDEKLKTLKHKYNLVNIGAITENEKYKHCGEFELVLAKFGMPSYI